MFEKLTLTVFKDGDGFRTIANIDSWDEYGESISESIGHQIRSLYNNGKLNEPTLIKIVECSNTEYHSLSKE